MFFTFSSENILYEDNHVLVILKPFNILVQGDSTAEPCILDIVKDFLKKRDDKPGNVFLGLVHRIDRPVAGCLLLAKTSKALSRLNEDLRKQEIEKQYLTIVYGKPAVRSQKLVNYLRKNSKQNKSYVVSALKNAKEASLTYRLIEQGDNYSLLDVCLHTGRHHQIRTQLAHIGLTVRGDVKYGAKRPNKEGHIDLLAHTLSFLHPISKEKITVVSPCPPDRLWQTLAHSL